ncbi:YeeE/YedE family protein [Aliiruegeria sabulilitoris]|uniref:YeeE/YedE family protein n=1 Tax=Aliiruegeria sabulilitoris TaxID=1510458 RepID=UPI00082FA348|nr:YeeE/YedE thiosulfate transporter family protein [Aliiruegeria sabulilitoris]NDR58608.1 YeeE/YedE family protein [Pseudoruegeria sp. M32A2M]
MEIVNFTPLASLFGGVLIGLAAVLLMAAIGRVMGATGILSAAIFAEDDRAWRWALLAGMISGPAFYLMVTGNWPEITVPVSALALIVGGFLVGIGVSYGSGCTSGHGVCGLARLSPRSFVAVPTFMATTALTVYVVRHVFGG